MSLSFQATETPKRKAAVIETLMRGGNMAEAAKAAGWKSATSIYEHAKNDPIFAWDVERSRHYGLENKVMPILVKLGIEGEVEYVWHNGRAVLDPVKPINDDGSLNFYTRRVYNLKAVELAYKLQGANPAFMTELLKGMMAAVEAVRLGQSDATQVSDELLTAIEEVKARKAAAAAAGDAAT